MKKVFLIIEYFVWALCSNIIGGLSQIIYCRKEAYRQLDLGYEKYDVREGSDRWYKNTIMGRFFKKWFDAIKRDIRDLI